MELIYKLNICLPIYIVYIVCIHCIAVLPVFYPKVVIPAEVIVADIDTRAITRRLREEGSLIGVLTTDKSKTDDELMEMAKTWKIVGKESYFGNCRLIHLVHFLQVKAWLNRFQG